MGNTQDIAGHIVSARVMVAFFYKKKKKAGARHDKSLSSNLRAPQILLTSPKKPKFKRFFAQKL